MAKFPYELMNPYTFQWWTYDPKSFTSQCYKIKELKQFLVTTTGELWFVKKAVGDHVKVNPFPSRKCMASIMEKYSDSDVFPFKYTAEIHEQAK